MQENILPIFTSFSLAGRLDDLCASTKDTVPPKPVRRNTSQCNREGFASSPIQKSTKVDCAKSKSPVISSCKTSQKSGCKRRQNAMLINKWAVGTASNRPSNSFRCLEQTTTADSTSEFFTNEILSPVISKPVSGATNMFFGVRSKSKMGLFSEKKRDLSLTHRTLYVNSDEDSDISDLEEEDDTHLDDESRWSHGCSALHNRDTSSELSMPPKPQRKASFATICYRKE